MSRIITFATDFSLKSAFVGVCKGVIYSINPDVKVVDICHDIEAFNITSASLLLRSYYSYYPLGTIHICVVDPGVGSQRRKLIVKSNGHYFIGPDNGIFSTVLTEPFEAVSITNPKYVLDLYSPTFQARDVFAPVSAWLAKGVSMYEFGETALGLVRLPLPAVTMTDHELQGQVIEIDSFGNAITNIMRAHLPKRDFKVFVNDIQVPFVSYYAQGLQGLGCLINSSGYLEFFVYQSSAVKAYGLKIGDTVCIR